MLPTLFRIFGILREFLFDYMFLIQVLFGFEFFIKRKDATVFIRWHLNKSLLP